MKKRLNFVILFQGRTGSSYLVDALNRHPDISAHGEMLEGFRYLVKPWEQLDPVRKLYAMVVRFWKGSPSQRQMAAVKNFYDNYQAVKSVHGFKTKVRDIIDPDGMKETLEQRCDRVIVMYRKNYVKQAVSHIRAEDLHKRTKHWNLYSNIDRLESDFIGFDLFDRALKQVIFHAEMLNAFVNYLDLPKLRLEYNELLEDRDKWFASIFDFLEVVHCPLTSDVLKNTDNNLRKAIYNFEDLRSKYVGTQFEIMFDE